MSTEDEEVVEKAVSSEPSIAQVDENGEVMIEQIAMEYLTKGSWQTVMFLYKERDQRTNVMSDLKVGIRRYQKAKGVLKLRSKFNISSKAQAKQMIEILERWYP